MSASDHLRCAAAEVSKKSDEENNDLVSLATQLKGCRCEVAGGQVQERAKRWSEVRPTRWWCQLEGSKSKLIKVLNQSVQISVHRLANYQLPRKNCQCRPN